MPYIDKEKRDQLDPLIEELAKVLTQNTLNGPSQGDYNYVITKLIHNYIEDCGLRYIHLNNAVGILECAKAEFIRTVVSPYEDEKRISNGCVSELDKNVQLRRYSQEFLNDLKKLGEMINKKDIEE